MSVNNIGSVVLTKLLRENNLEAWAKLRKDYLHSSLHTVYAIISKHCDKFSKLPTFEELDLEFREGGLRRSLDALKSVETENIDIDVALDALVNEFTQNEVLKLLSSFLDKLSVMDSEETKAALSDIVLKVDEKTFNENKVVVGADFTFFEDPEVTKGARFSLGFSNKFDAEVGVFREEYILIGGKRGSGKSVICSNIQVNQYEQGNICPYFTIEMKAAEVMHRNMAILAGVPHKHIRHNKLSFEEEKRLALVKAGMFTNGMKYYEEFLNHRNRYDFEISLRKHGIPSDTQLIVIDDRKLSLAAIDMHLGKLKAKYGDKLTMAVVDYLNQIEAESGSSTSKYDWIPQIFVSAKLKEFGRKYDLTLISPYQIDASGEARFSKGILDSADVAMTLEVEDNGIGFNLTKIRGAGAMKFASGMDRDELTTLRINPNELELPDKEEKKSTRSDSGWKTPGSDVEGAGSDIR